MMGDKTMTKSFQIENTRFATILGVYEGADEAEALDAMARDAGYADYADCCAEIAGEGDLLVTEVKA